MLPVHALVDGPNVWLAVAPLMAASAAVGALVGALDRRLERRHPVARAEQPHPPERLPRAA